MKRTKGTTIVIIVLLSVVILLLLGIMIMGILGVGHNLHTFSANYEKPNQSEAFEFDPTQIKSIEIDSDYSNIELKESNTDKIIVEGNTSSTFSLTAELDGRTLEISRSGNNIITFSPKSPKVDTVIYLPKDFSCDIDIEADCGDITSDTELKGKFTFHADYGNIELDSVEGEFDLSTDMGNIEIDDLQLTSDSIAHTDMGNIEIEKLNPVNIIADTDLGSTKVHGSDSSSNIDLTAETDMGNIEINNN